MNLTYFQGIKKIWNRNKTKIMKKVNKQIKNQKKHYNNITQFIFQVLVVFFY